MGTSTHGANKRQRSVWALCAMALLACALLLTSGCASEGGEQADADGQTSSLSLAIYRDPICYGLLPMLDKEFQEQAERSYDVVVGDSLSALVEGIGEGVLDLALVPANTAARLAAQGADVRVVAALAPTSARIMSANQDIRGLDDLESRTLYLTGEGTTTECDLRMLLDAADLEGKVDLVVCNSSEDAIAAVDLDEQAACLLEEPYASYVRSTRKSLRVVVDVADVWKGLVDVCGVPLTGVIVARTGLIEEHPEDVAAFLRDLEVARQIVEEPEALAQLLLENDMVEDADVGSRVEERIDLSLVYGADLKERLAPYYHQLLALNPELVAEAEPADDFYYAGA